MSRTKHHGDKNKERIHGEGWRWWSNEPRWWRKMMELSKYRRTERDRLKAVEKGAAVTDWPDFKRPANHYW